MISSSAALLFLSGLAIGGASGSSFDSMGRSSETQQDELVSASSDANAVDVSNRYVFGMRWHRRVVRTGAHRQVAVSFGRPAIAERAGRVVVGTGEGFVLAYDLRTGREVWQVDYGVPFEAPAVTTVLAEVDAPVASEAVLAAARDGTLLLFRARDGTEIWRASVEGDVRAAPAVVDGLVFLTTANNKVLCIELGTGKIRWTQGRSMPQGLTVEGHGAPAIDRVRARVYATFSDGYVAAFGLGDGARLWERPLSLQGDEFGDSDADPVLDSGRLFVASYSDGVYALDPNDGHTLWRRSASAVTSLAATDEGRLVAASSDGYVWGLRQSDGQLAFRTRVPPGPMSSMVVEKGFIALSAGASGLLVLDALSGKPIQATPVGGRAAGAPAWSGNDLAMMSGSGRLYIWSLGAPGLVR